MFKKTLDIAETETTSGTIKRIRETKSRGQVLSKPSSGHPHKVQGTGIRTKEGRGGRHTPFFNGYRPQFY